MESCEKLEREWIKIDEKIFLVQENEKCVITIYGIIGMKQYYLKKPDAVESYMDSVFYATRK